MAGSSYTEETAQAVSELCELLEEKLDAIIAQLTLISSQLTATQDAFGEENPQTLGENIQDLRDDTREGVERGKDLLRKRGLE